MERATKITEDFFVNPAKVTVKLENSIKIALYSRKLKEATIKRKAQLPNLGEIISRISRKVTEGKTAKFGFQNQTLISSMAKSNWTNNEETHFYSPLRE